MADKGNGTGVSFRPKGLTGSPDAAFDLYTRGIDRWWRLVSPYWNDGKRAVGTGWECVADGLDTSRGYSMGAAELLGWYREASTAG
jgi:hypothetical protein